MKKKYLYLKVTNDKYELPIVVADSSLELAKLCGISQRSVLNCIHRHEFKGRPSSYIKVEIDENEEGEMNE